MIRIITIVGARPQFIKAAAISRAIRTHFSGEIKEDILHTGQHYDDAMSEVFFRDLEIPAPVYNLGVGSNFHGVQTAAMIQGIESILMDAKPDLLLAYGDTNSTLAAAIAGSKLHIPIAHVEAGLRSFNKAMPEEINRIVCDHCATFLFTPTQDGFQNLLHEGFLANAAPPFSSDHPYVEISGDVMYDNAIYFGNKKNTDDALLKKFGVDPGKYILLTLHRDHNTDNGEKLKDILDTLAELARTDGYSIIFPVHPRTRKEIENKDITTGSSVLFTAPLSYLEMLSMERNAHMIFTDSGGVQKEACFHEKKCLVLRPETEWVELARHGMLEVAGTDRDSIIRHYQILKSRNIDSFPRPYGTGNAAEKICQSILQNYTPAK